ncbi:MAG: polysaccharide biosynthesis tyrosine autokinase [Proteobacteria bacterium]|nr:polysaccharide biosynthesis tyrosine autokinase [Pseudomonadota bacterium]MBI3497936.1 polysaccharide biosynthesis tyrosine autokinase [Pseudomonadota bacterium]
MSTNVAPIARAGPSTPAESQGLGPLTAPLAPATIGTDPARQYLQFVFDVLRRRRWFVLCFAVLIAGIAAMIVNQIDPLYRAETQLVLDAPQSRSPASGLASLLGGGGGDLFSNETEAAVLTSLNLADRIVKVLNLGNSPFFTGSRSLGVRLGEWRQDLQAHLSLFLPQGYRQYLAPAKAEEPKPPPTGELANRVYETYFRNLTVRAGDRSRVIEIRFIADDPRLAAAVANTLAATYIEDQVTEARRVATRETSWLAGRLQEARTRVDDVMQRLEEFRASAGILDLNGNTAQQRQMVEYNQQLMTAQIRRADLDGRARQLQQLIDGGGRFEDSEIALDAPGIQQLRNQETAAARQLAELATQYREAHPRLQQAQAELDDIHAKIKAEMRRLVAAAANQARLAKDQETALAAKVSELTQELQQQGKSQLTLRLLEADLKTSSTIYETMLNRMREVNAMEGRIDTPLVRVISRAIPPDHPFFPNKPLLVTVAAAVAAMFGVLLAFVLDLLDVGFRNRQQIENLTGLETVASLPWVKPLDQARRLGDMRRILRARTEFAEAVRYIRVSLSLSPDPNRPVRSILVTSAFDGEGKTFTSRALAVTYAVGEKRVITVDCDLRQRLRRRSRQGEADPLPGLAEYLLGAADAGEIFGTDRATGLDHIDCGDTKTLVDAPILLSSERMRNLLHALSTQYDMVILDTPPVKRFPDTLILQQEVDKVLFLIRWAKTPREMALDALKTIIQSGHMNPVVGLTQVDLRHLRRYDYAANVSKHHRETYLPRPEAG